MFNTITFGNKDYLGRWITVDDELILAVDSSLKYDMNRSHSKINITFQKYLDMNIIRFVPANVLYDGDRAIITHLEEEKGFEQFA